MSPLTQSSLFALLVAVCARAGAVERLPIDVTSTAWTPYEGSTAVTLSTERTPSDARAVAMRCTMARVRDRSYWDIKLPLDLSRYGKIAFWAKVTGDAAAIGSCTIYLQSGAGWYGAPFALPDEGWARIVLDRGAFKPEDTPAGFQAITAIRMAFWKAGATEATVLVGGMEAEAADVVVVRNTRAGQEADTWTERMGAALQRAGIDLGAVDDRDVEAGVLKGKKIAIFPQNPSPSDKEMDAVNEFVRAGGRILVCFSLPPRLGKLLGIDLVEYVAAKPADEFSVMQFQPSVLPGMPARVEQSSWNIDKVKPAEPRAKVIAEWCDAAGKPTGCPAVVLSDVGAYISHVLLDDDAPMKDRMLRALLGHFDPDIWKDAANNALLAVGNIRGGQSKYEDVAREIASSGKLGMPKAVGGVEIDYRRASDDLKQGRYPESVDASTAAKAKLTFAYAVSRTSRAGEFRGVWCHSAYGLPGMTWDAAIKRLKENGFNAIVPNMLWGGVADYESKVLPVRDRVAREGDQIAKCLAACKRYGIEMHVWKVNWNLGGAPADFVAKMRSERRLQHDFIGHEVDWLCPSNPSNFALERDAMLEVARNYDVSGIHFDYIRYPDSTSCYCEGCRTRFETAAGVKVANWPADVRRDGPRYQAYQDFRRSNITRLVKAVSEGARKIRPGIKISAAVFSDWPQCRDDVGQDWGAWIKAGYLDFVCPMDYTASDREFRAKVRVQRDEIAGRIPLYPGIGASAPGLPIGQVMDQIAIARTERAGGFIVFNYDGEFAQAGIALLGLGATAGPSVPPHAAKK